MLLAAAVQGVQPLLEIDSKACQKTWTLELITSFPKEVIHLRSQRKTARKAAQARLGEVLEGFQLALQAHPQLRLIRNGAIQVPPHALGLFLSQARLKSMTMA